MCHNPLEVSHMIAHVTPSELFTAFSNLVVEIYGRPPTLRPSSFCLFACLFLGGGGVSFCYYASNQTCEYLNGRHLCRGGMSQHQKRVLIVWMYRGMLYIFSRKSKVVLWSRMSFESCISRFLSNIFGSHLCVVPSNMETHSS